MDKSWTCNKLVLKITKFLFKHRQSIGKVKLYFSIRGLLQKVYRGIATLLPILTVVMQVILSSCILNGQVLS